MSRITFLMVLPALLLSAPLAILVPVRQIINAVPAAAMQSPVFWVIILLPVVGAVTAFYAGAHMAKLVWKRPARGIMNLVGSVFFTTS